MICQACGEPIIFYAHQAIDGKRMIYWHPECCPACPHRDFEVRSTVGSPNGEPLGL